MVDERTNIKWLDFYVHKNDMIEPTCEQFNKWKQEGKPVEIVRCDGGGENKAHVKRCNSVGWKLNVNVEWTARNTSQQNCPAEVAIATIGNRARDMMIAANVPYAMRFRIYCEAYKCATLLDGLVVKDIYGSVKTRMEHWGMKLPCWSAALQTWGEAGVVTFKQKMRPKMEDKGLTCMLVGYAEDHAKGVYRMWNPTTGGVHEPRDVTWIKRMYYTQQPTALEI